MIVHSSKLFIFRFSISAAFSIALLILSVFALWGQAKADTEISLSLYLVSCIALSLSPIAVAAVYRYAISDILSWLDYAVGAGIISRDSDDIKEWLAKLSKPLFEPDYWVYVLACFFGVSVVTAVNFSEWYIALNGQALYLVYLVLFLSESYACVGLLLLLLLAQMLALIASDSGFRIRPDKSKLGILGLGDVMFLIWFGVLLVWIILQFGGVFANESFELAEYLQSYPLILIGYPSLLIILGSFFLGILPWSERILQYKKARFSELNSLFLDPYSKDKVLAKKQTFEEAEVIEKRIEHIEKLPNWPVSTKTRYYGMTATFLAQYPVVESVLSYISKFIT